MSIRPYDEPDYFSKKSIEQRFLQRVNKTVDCWLWVGGKHKTGYGRFYIGRGEAEYAHRTAYRLWVEDVPDGLIVDHLCRNRLCVRPDHLEAVTHRENILRGVGASAKNAVKTHCPKNHPYDDENTYKHPRGLRICRQCARENQRRRRKVEGPS